jgi:hypothetical protein
VEEEDEEEEEEGKDFVCTPRKPFFGWFCTKWRLFFWEEWHKSLVAQPKIEFNESRILFLTPPDIKWLFRHNEGETCQTAVTAGFA